MTHSPRTTRFLLLGTLLAVGGCFSLARAPSPPRHYVLGGGGDGATATAAPSRTSIGLRPPRLAEYLATPFIVVRRDVHQIGFSEFDRWGEDVARGIVRTVARRMAAREPALRVETTPWPTTAQPDYLIEMDILRFEGVAPGDSASVGGEAHILATWEITHRRDGALVASGTTEVREAGWTVGDFHGLVALLDAALDTLAAELVLGLEGAVADRPPRPHPEKSPESDHAALGWVVPWLDTAQENTLSGPVSTPAIATGPTSSHDFARDHRGQPTLAGRALRHPR